MKKSSDKMTFKIKRKPQKKEKDSNSSKDSLELEMKSYRQNHKSQKKIGEGEEIKFFFNDLPMSKRLATASNKNKLSNLNSQREKDEFDFKEILLNYVSQSKRTNEKKTHKKEKDSVIFSKPNEILTLNGEDNITNKEEFSSPIIESNSESSNNNSLSESSSDKVTEKEEKNKNINIKKEKNENNAESSGNIKKTILKKNKKDKKEDKNNINKNRDIKEIKKDKKEKKEKKVKILSDRKIQKVESNINSNNNKLSYSNKIINSNRNTYTTATNTFKTQNTLNSSFKSLQINLKKFNYDYLNLNDLPIQKKLLIKNKIISEKKMINNEENEIRNNIKLIKNENNPFDKIKNLDISLDKEKSYIIYFRNIINLQNQKNYYMKMPKIVNNESNYTQMNFYPSQRYFYYPDEFYLDKSNDLHSKTHISTIFKKLRKKQ